MDLVAKYSQLLRPVQQGLSQIGNNISHAFNNAPTHAPHAGAITQFTQPIVNHAAQQMQQNKPIYVPQMTQHHNAPQGAKLLNDYVHGQILTPITQGVQGLKKPDLLSKATSVASIVGGGLSATPAGAAFNTGVGLSAGIAKSLKNKAPLDASIRQGITNPTSVGTDVLGIKNPVLAGAVDLATSRSPKAILKDPTGIKGITKVFGKGKDTQALKGYSPKAFDIHPEDQQVMKDFVNTVQTGGATKDLGQLGKDAQAIADHYIGKSAKDIGNVKMAKAFDALLASHAKSRGEDVLQTPYPKMGFAAGKDVKTPSIVSQSRANAGSKLKGNIPQTPIAPPAPAEGHPSLNVPADLKPGQVVSGETQPKTALTRDSSGGIIPHVPNSQDPYFNTNKLNVSDKAKKQVNQVIQEVKPQIEQAVGKPLTNKEVINTTNNSSKILHTVVDRTQTEDFSARLLKTRQQLAAAANSGTVDQTYIDNLMAVKSHATDIARKLQSFSIGADPKTMTSRDAILEAVMKVEKNSAKITEAAKGVNFNDLNQATAFYRQFVKPKAGEWVDLVRYNSMLSSPNTHINNAASNLINTAVVAPVEKAVTGAIDFLHSSIKGTQQNHFVGEAPAYVKGYFGSIHDAAHQFAKVMSGKAITTNLDVRQIPLAAGGLGGKTVSRLNIPTKLLEASDQFFTTLTKNGETASLQYAREHGGKVGNIETKALDNAKYRLFRGELHDKRQGALLHSIDNITSLIQKARNMEAPQDATQGQKMGAQITSTVAKFTLPFIQTPMNMLKQGIEYSPAGLATVIGASNKTEQLSKAIIGSSAAAATALLVSSGRTTWAEPTDPTKKAAFRSAGLQPYAVKIGDNWVSYAKLPPALGFPIAFMSAIHDAQQKQTMDQSTADAILNGVAKWGNFFADQSYLKNIGDLISASKGSPEAMGQFVSNYPQQLVPYRALLGWMARMTDPYQRKVDTSASYIDQQVKQLMIQIPGLSQMVPARTDKAGNPIVNQNPVLNAVSPFKVTTENPEKKAYLDLLNQKSLNTKNGNIIKQKILKGEPITSQQAGASDGSNPQLALQQKAQEAATKTKVKLTGQAQAVNGKYIYSKDGTTHTIDLNPKTPGQGIDAFSNQSDTFTKAREVYASSLPDNLKQQAYQKLGIDQSKVEYDYKAHHSTDVKSQYISAKAQTEDHTALLKDLMSGRTQSISGQVFASNTVLDSLATDGVISQEEAKALKAVKMTSDGKRITSVKGIGKGKRIKVAIPKLPHLKTPKAPKVTKVKQYKMNKVHLTKVKKLKA